MKKTVYRYLACIMVLMLCVTLFAPVKASAATITTINPTLNATSKNLFVSGGKKKFNFNVENKVKDSRYVWKTSDASIATVNKKNGVVKAVAPGTVTITCSITAGTYKKDLTATVIVKLRADSIVINNGPNNKVMQLGESFDFNSTLTPKNATDKTYWFISSTNNTAKATVKANGVVTPKSEGSFTIRAITAASKAKFNEGVYLKQSAPVTITVEGKKPEVRSIAAINDKTIEITFNQEISNAISSNFSIINSSNVSLSISSVTTTEDKIKLTLSSPMLESNIYKITVTGIKGKATGTVMETLTKDITYKKPVPVSIQVVNNTVLVGEQIAYIIKDAQGNDITANYSITTDLIIGTSNSSVIDQYLIARAMGSETISIQIRNTSVMTTGQTIHVVDSKAEPIKISGITLGELGTEILSISRNDYNKYLSFMVNDSDGSIMASYNKFSVTGNASFSFESRNRQILVVDEATGAIIPISKGTAVIVITATVNNKTITGQAVIEVREEPYLNTIKVSNQNIKVVRNSGITTTFEVELLDQYGAIYTERANVTYYVSDTSKLTIYDGESEAGLTARTLKVDGGKARIEVSEKVGAKVGSTTITLFANNKTVNVSALLVEPGTFDKYVAVVSSKTLDINSSKEGLPLSVSPGDKTASIEVYKLDNNGNYMGRANDVTIVDANTSSSSPVYVMSYSDGAVVVANNVGMELVDVSVGTAIVERVLFTVVDSSPTIKTVTVNQRTINAKIGDTIYFWSSVSSVFSGKDQYNQPISIEYYDVASTNSTILTASGMNVYANKAGTAGVVVVIKDIMGNVVHKDEITVVVSDYY